jgi:diguanylate cyclase (GGDEF)-like protein
MLPKSRALSRMLTTQVVASVLLTGAVGSWMWQHVDAQRTHVELPRQTIQAMQHQAFTVARAPFASLAVDMATTESEGGTGSDAAAFSGSVLNVDGHKQSANKAIAEAHASLNVLEGLAGRSAISANIEQAHMALDAVDAANAFYWAAETPQTQATALSELELTSASFQEVISTLQSTFDSEVRATQTATAVGMLVMWATLVTLCLGIAIITRRKVSAVDASEHAALTAAVEDLTVTLERAIDGESVMIDPDHRILEPLADMIRSATEKMQDLRTTTARIRQRTSFTHQLMDALDLSDTEEEVLRTAMRAGRLATPNAMFQLLMADGPEGDVEAQTPDCPSACSLNSPQNCPAIRKGRTLFNRPEAGLSRCPRLTQEDTSVTCTPINVSGQSVGIAQVIGTHLDEGEVEDVEAVAMSLGARLSTVRNMAERELEAGTDPLTELPNRRALNEKLVRLDLTDLPYCVVSCDLDHFKSINDRFGHDTGDRCLQLFAEVMRDACRASDLPVRMGGEEFVMLLPGVGMEAGISVAKRVEMFLAKACENFSTPFTVSMGVAARPDHGDRSETVLRVADQALYMAKEAGRNQYVPAPLPEAGTPSLEVVGSA